MQELDKRRNPSPLRTERIQHHWSQRELAERVGATVATVKRWERQATVPGPYFRLKLAALFGKSEEALGLREVSVLPVPPSASEATCEELPQPVSTATSPLWTIPYLRNPYFTGRDELFCLLDEHLAVTQDESGRTRRVALTQPQALTGLGGIGKTQLAVEYAYRAHEQGVYTHTLWINAASEEAILTSFTSFAELLPAFVASKETDQQKVVNAIKQWLEQCPQRWLLIFDNADDLSLLQRYFPCQGNGSVLLTTRAHAVGSLATSIEVEKMGFLEGTHLLLHRARRLAQASDDEVTVAGKLVVALDHFPLALEQAGAYIEEIGCTFEQYLQLYQTHRSALLARRGAQASNYPDSVATTWLLSFENVKQSNPAAAQLLQLCAFLAPDHIPEELIREGATYWPTLLQQAVTDPLAFDQVLEALLRFSLVKRLAEDHLLSIHRLVQVVQMEMIKPEEQRQWAEQVVHAINSLFPRQPREDVRSWPQCLRYLEQVQACATLIEEHGVRLAEAADLLDRAGTYLRVHASYPLAEALYLQALRLREEVLGKNHPETASSLHNLGFLSWDQGKYEQAERYYQQALHIREEQLGTNHPVTSATLNNLGIIYWEQRKYELAESYYQRSLAIKEEQLGTHHPDMAIALNNLGVLSYEQGKYELVESYYKRALAIYETQLGTRHLGTARTLNNLGLLYSKQGKYELAEAYHQRALMILEEQLGTHHLGTARTLNNLGLLYSKQGKYELAEAYCQQALVVLEEQWGAYHPETARIWDNLAELYWAQHEYEQAEPLSVRALEIQEHTLTANHSDLARTLHGFARFHEAQGTLQTAVALYQWALSIREQVYGPHHPKTSETRECLQTVLHLLEKEVQQEENPFSCGEVERSV
jgi:tetratricopeptide (TPR) repeat protein/transcriptional regulator with XRE-family HTH domain